MWLKKHTQKTKKTNKQIIIIGRKEMFYLTTHSTHFIYGYMASDIWLRTILIVRKETRCRHIGYSYRLTARVLLYAPSHRQDNTYHGLWYTSRGALAGIIIIIIKPRNWCLKSSLYPPEAPVRTGVEHWMMETYEAHHIKGWTMRRDEERAKLLSQTKCCKYLLRLANSHDLSALVVNWSNYILIVQMTIASGHLSW